MCGRRIFCDVLCWLPKGRHVIGRDAAIAPEIGAEAWLAARLRGTITYDSAIGV